MTPPTLAGHHHLRWTPLALIGLMALVSGCRDSGDQASAAAPAPDGEEVAVSHILVAFDGVTGAPDGLERSRDEAHERSRRLAVLLRTGRGDLPSLARRYSDDPTAQQNGGYLGIFHEGDMDPTFEAAVCSLQVGQIGGPFETTHGFHVVRREPVRRVCVHHLLITYDEAALANPHVTRHREEAARIARALRRKAADGDADLCDLAVRFSDDSENNQACGQLGWVVPGMLTPEAERAVFALAPGEISPVVESEYGFHIFWRD